MPELGGIHHVKIPVTDVARSLAWYQKAFGLKTTMDFSEEGVLKGVVGEIPGLTNTFVALRENIETAKALSGFDPIAFGVLERSDVEAWEAHMDEVGIAHLPVVAAAMGWILRLQDPDGLEVHIYSWAKPEPESVS